MDFLLADYRSNPQPPILYSNPSGVAAGDTSEA